MPVPDQDALVQTVAVMVPEGLEGFTNQRHRDTREPTITEQAVRGGRALPRFRV